MHKLIAAFFLLIFTELYCFPDRDEDLSDKVTRRSSGFSSEHQKQREAASNRKRSVKEIKGQSGSEYPAPLRVPKTLKGWINRKCQKFAYVEEIKRDGCLPQLVTRTGCIGLCTSITIPNGNGLVQRCETCLPNSNSVEVKEITLHCTGRNSKKSQTIKFHHIKKCDCQKVKCKDGRANDESKVKQLKVYSTI